MLIVIMAQLEYHAIWKMGVVKSAIVFLSNDNKEIGRLLISTGLAGWSGKYEENGNPLFIFDYSLVHGFLVKDLNNSLLYKIAYNTFTGNAEASDSNKKVICTLANAAGPWPILPVLSNSGGGFFRMLHGGIGSLEVLGPKGQTIGTIKHEGFRKARVSFDGSKLNKDLGIALLAICSYL